MRTSSDCTACGLRPYIPWSRRVRGGLYKMAPRSFMLVFFFFFSIPDFHKVLSTDTPYFSINPFQAAVEEFISMHVVYYLEGRASVRSQRAVHTRRASTSYSTSATRSTAATGSRSAYTTHIVTVYRRGERQVREIRLVIERRSTCRARLAFAALS